MIKILSLLLLMVLACSQKAPVLAPEFQFQFQQTAKVTTVGHTKGVFYYDLLNHRQVVTRQNGKRNIFCDSIFKFTDTACNHIIINNKRFLDFPQKQYCCYCCDNTHGCGILAPDWIGRSNGTYAGTEQIDQNGPYEKWIIEGNQQNYYYYKNDTNQTPRRLCDTVNDVFDVTKYILGPVDSKVFQLPAYCTSKCGPATICAQLRGQVTK